MTLLSKTKICVILATCATFALILTTACAGGATQEDAETTAIPVKFEQGKLIPDLIQVSQGDTVFLKIEAAEAGQIHFHGYNIEKDVIPGEIADVSFLAHVSGKFQITLHGTATEAEKDLGILEVLNRYR